ncbi:hypothetical protein AC579_3144 [Pseudocercospora musae]|uniref:Uncharacterized protein n=1 Tax=Pseudocercospora musae TaxID=113226 RepID=A0A139H5U9_9PEZI|nr:hypothetical protein AC579_3144 [Pseudocercospora musae]
MAQPSAAARVFATPELLEHIVISLMTIEPCKINYDYLRAPFVLLRVCHQFKDVIESSKQIREMDLGKTIRMWQSIHDWDRIAWMCQDSGLFALKATGYESSKRTYALEIILYGCDMRKLKLGDNANASWRRVKCFPMGHDEVKVSLEIENWRAYSSVEGRYSRDIRKEYSALATWTIQDDETLGELYDDLIDARMKYLR